MYHVLNIFCYSPAFKLESASEKWKVLKNIKIRISIKNVLQYLSRDVLSETFEKLNGAII